MAMGPRRGSTPGPRRTDKPAPPIRDINVEAINSFGNALSNSERRMASRDWESFTNRMFEFGGSGDTNLKQYKNLRDSLAQGALIAGRARTRAAALEQAAKELKPLMDQRAKNAAKKTAKAERGRTAARGKSKNQK